MEESTTELKRDSWFAAGLFFTALVPRLYVALNWAREPIWDGHYYHFGATRIAQGLGYSEDILVNGVAVWKPWCHYPVGFSGVLGALYKLTGPELWVAPVLNAVLGALSVLLVYFLARAWLGSWRARLAGILCALHPGLIVYSAVAMTEPLCAFGLLVCGALVLWLDRAPASKGRALWAAVSSGVAVGLGALVRPTTLLAGPWLLALFRGSWLRRLALAFVAGCFALLTILPWTLRNCRVMDECTLISTNGGWNLAIGAMTETGRFSPLSAKWGCPGPGQVNQDRCWGEIGRKLIAEDPLGWLARMPSKLAQTYNHESFAIAYLAEADPESWSPERKWQWQKWLTIFHHLLMLAASLSTLAIALPRRDNWVGPVVQVGLFTAVAGYFFWALGQAQPPLFWLLVVAPLIAFLRLPGAPPLGPAATYAWGLIAMTSLTHAIFFGEDRYHLTISPVLCLLAAGALRLSPPSVREPAPLPQETSSTQRLRLWQRLGARLIRAAAKLEWLFDLLIWGYRKRFGRLGRTEILAYRSFGTQDAVWLRGRVVEAKQRRQPLESDRALRNLLFMWRRFMTREIPEARVRGTLGRVSAEAVTDEEGYFVLPLAGLPEPDAAKTEGLASATTARLELVDCPVRGLRPTHAELEVYRPHPEAQYVVISDIDDTVLQTHVRQRVKMVWTTLLGNAYTRRGFEGTPELYRALLRGNQRQPCNPLFYVSKSPWNLYDFLCEFLERHGLPKGPLLLRDFGLNLQGSLDFKTVSIENLLQTYANLPCVLLGDDGERDPDIYLGLAAKYPGRVRAIYIRRVAGGYSTRTADEFVRRAAEVSTTLVFIRTAHDALAHAIDTGLVSPATRETA